MKNLFKIWKEKNTQKRVPIAYLCYKSRNEEIDDEIVTNLEKIGFEGDQVIFFYFLNGEWKMFMSRFQRMKWIRNI